MFVVLLTGALLALSSAQSTDGDVTNTETSDGQADSGPNQQTENLLADSSTDANSGDAQGGESLPQTNEEASSTNAESEPEQQQAVNQVNSDSAESKPENPPVAQNEEQAKHSCPSPEYSPGRPKQRIPKIIQFSKCSGIFPHNRFFKRNQHPHKSKSKRRS